MPWPIKLQKGGEFSESKCPNGIYDYLTFSQKSMKLWRVSGQRQR
jgi:hypothetical protein